MSTPNPLTDELTPEAKAELAAIFADMKRRMGPLRLHEFDRPHARPSRSVRRPWELQG